MPLSHTGGISWVVALSSMQLWNQRGYFQDIKETQISADSLELAETLITKTQRTSTCARVAKSQVSKGMASRPPPRRLQTEVSVAR